MNAASTPSSMPFSENEAASGEERVELFLREYGDEGAAGDSRRPEGRDVAEYHPEMAAEIYEFPFHASLSFRASVRRLLYLLERG